MLSETCQTQKGKFGVISLICESEKVTHKNRVEWCLPGAGVGAAVGRNGKVLVKGDKVSLIQDK